MSFFEEVVLPPILIIIIAIILITLLGATGVIDFAWNDSCTCLYR